MSDLLVNGKSSSVEQAAKFQHNQAQIEFRARFQRSLRACVKRRLSVEECFGAVWQETFEEVALFEDEQSELYGELIEWARQLRK